MRPSSAPRLNSSGSASRLNSSGLFTISSLRELSVSTYGAPPAPPSWPARPMLSSWSASSLSPSTRTQSASQHSRTAQPLIDRLMHLESMGQDELRKTAHARNQLAQDLQKARASALGREKINTERIRNLQESFKRAEGTIAGLRADLQGKDAEMEALRQQLAEANTALSACDGARKLALDEARVWKARAHAAIRDAAEAREATGREQRARDEALATEKAARVSQVSKQILRRALCRELSLGWTAWVERTRAKLYALGRLREVANRLHSETREVAGAFYWWAEDARASKAEMRETSITALFQRLQDSEAQVRRLQRAVRDQEPATAKYTKGKRLQRAAEGREARKRLQDAFELAAPPSKSK